MLKHRQVEYRQIFRLALPQYGQHSPALAYEESADGQCGTFGAEA